MAMGLRSIAFDIMSRRDGFAGWRRHRCAFRALVQSTPEEVSRHAQASLSRLLHHAYETVPYYRDQWRSVGFTPYAGVTSDDLERLPLLTQDDIRTRVDDLVSRAFGRGDLLRDYTGGTMANPTPFYRNRECRAARFGRQWGVLESCGYRPGDKRGLIWGAHVDLPLPGAPSTFKRRFRQFASGDEVLCCGVMTDADLLDYYQRLRTFRPRVVYGYPNAIEEFATWIQRNGLRPVRVARVLCTAERLSDHQRRLFEDVFGAEVFNLYCSRDHGCVAFECHRHRGFHVDAGNAIVEILRDGRRAEPGESGELVITDLLNYGMPLIRHATADMATAAAEPCDCGSSFPLFSSLDGRTADLLHRPDGSIVAGIMLPDLFMHQPAIAQAQFVQEDPASLDVSLVLSPGASADIRGMVLEEIRSVMGRDIAIRLRFVDDIPRNPRSGKYQEVICKVRRPHGTGELVRS